MRYLTSIVEKILAQERRMVFVAGPRQVGKTTLVRHLLERVGAPANYFLWDNDAHRKAILKKPDNFWRTDLPTTATGGRIRLALDEIHKYPRWKRFLKGFFDVHGRDLQVLVTGSGRLDLYQRGGDSLFGRYALFHLHPFTLGEMLRQDRATVQPPGAFWRTVMEEPTVAGAEEGLAQLERFSGFPEPLFAASATRAQRWKGEHHRLLIREDLRDLTRIREIGLMESLLALLPERVGTPLSINSLREDLNVAFDTVQSWIETLERLYYLFEIRPFAGRLSRALRREGKIYFFDFTEVEDPGPRFENIVALHLRKLVDAWNDWGYGDFALHYVRNREKKETDFLITDRKKPHALIEAKLADTTVDPSLFYFAGRLKPSYALQVVRHADQVGAPRRHSGVTVMGASHFLGRI